MAHDLQMAMQGMMEALKAVREAIDDNKNVAEQANNSTTKKKKKTKPSRGKSSPEVPTVGQTGNLFALLIIPILPWL